MQTAFQATVSFKHGTRPRKRTYFVHDAEQLKALDVRLKKNDGTVIGHRIIHIMSPDEVLADIATARTEP